MSSSVKVDHLADGIKKTKKSKILAKFFKNALKVKLKNLSIGFITVTDESEKFSFGDKNSELKSTLSVHSQEFYILIGSGGAMGLAEAYMLGYWSSENVLNLMRIVVKNRDVLLSLNKGISRVFNPLNKIIHWTKQNTINGSKKNIVAHYDLSNEFYKLWLDPSMTYSCAFFENKDTSLEDASIEKIDRICRKLSLTENDSVLEIGTGWGSFAIYAAKKYGCNITTTTISDKQYEYAKSRIKEEGLGNKIKLINQDYRELNGLYDKIVSIEMIEAIGYQYIEMFFSKLSSLLKPSGLVGLQGITYNDQNFDTFKDSVDFIKKYIFPGSCLISIAQIINVIKSKSDLAMIDMEDITRHYPKTLKKWRENFMAVVPQVKEMGYSQSFVNMWEYYFLYCEAGFLERNIGDFQLVFAKSGARDIKVEY